MAQFFIDRPIFAWVIAIIIMLAGLLAVRSLPISQYPNIAPPQINISATYPGASAKTVEDTVTQVIEQQLKGIDHLEYISSTSDSSGRASIDITFEAGSDVDIAQVQVQNKLQLANPMLPEEVQRQGVSVTKASTSFLLVIAFTSDNPETTKDDISDYVSSTLQDPISRITGVGEATIFGSQYAMRIWCNPIKMEQYKLNPSDVVAAIKAQNAQVAGGQIGAAPAVEGQLINMTINAKNRLESVDQFEKILLKINPDGSSLYLKDVARVELGAAGYNAFARYNGKAAAGMGIKLAPGANALNTAKAVEQELAHLSQNFPEGMKATFPFDTTPFISIAIYEVFKTLVEAIGLVFLVMFLFLQSFRATIIPTIVVPVVLLGTFAVLSVAGFSINTLTMFATVLAIGLLVDDAIIVVENVERLMREERLSPKEAAKKSMSQISGALFGMTTVLSAVFIPMAFFGGSVGVIYRQFSVTIIAAMVISLLMALILTPALCATLLLPHQQEAQHGFFGGFNHWFNSVSIKYQQGVERILGKMGRYVILYLGFLGILIFLFLRMPSSFLPNEDQGIMFVSIQLPPGSTFERTTKVLEKVEKYFLEKESETVDSLMTVAGFSFSGNGQNNAIGFIRLKDWDERKRADQKVSSLARRSMGYFSQIKEAQVFSFAPPAIMELGSSSGFDFILQDQGSLGHEKLMEARMKVLIAASQNPNLQGVRPNGLDDEAQYNLNIDLAKAGALSISLSEINAMISAYWGSTYVNDFMDKGRAKKVYLQADKEFRMQDSDFYKYSIRNAKNEMVPLSAFITGQYSYGSPRLQRYNGFPSLEFLGEAAAGKSSGDAMDIMENIAKELPSGFSFSWTGMSYQERLSGAQAPALYALSLLIVFLCLAALYESWSIPFSVMLVVPLGVLGAITGATLRGLSNDVYFQVGLLTTIGLSAKNAILIVEFARENEEEGMGIIQATLHAVRMRLRPIVMTSMAFILGVLPLAISSGAGSGSQNAIGTGVMAGTLAATTLGIYYTPVFFVLVSKIFKVKTKQR